VLAGWVDVGGAGVPDEWLEVEEDVIEDEVEAEFVVERDVGRRPPTMLPNRPPPVDEGLYKIITSVREPDDVENASSPQTGRQKQHWG
jgi:hypothetical protein